MQGTWNISYWKITLSKATVTAALCTDILKLKLKPAICNKPRGLLAEGIILLNNNMHFHSAPATSEAIRQLKFGLLPNPHIVWTQLLSTINVWTTTSLVWMNTCQW